MGLSEYRRWPAEGRGGGGIYIFGEGPAGRGGGSRGSGEGRRRGVAGEEQPVSYVLEP